MEILILFVYLLNEKLIMSSKWCVCLSVCSLTKPQTILIRPTLIALRPKTRIYRSPPAASGRVSVVVVSVVWASSMLV